MKSGHYMKLDILPDKDYLDKLFLELKLRKNNQIYNKKYIV